MYVSHCNDDHLKRIPSLSSQTFLFKPMSGSLNQRKYLPIRFMPTTIEIVLIDEPSDAIISSMGKQGFAAANISTTWQIMNVQAKCDLLTLDSGLNESYVKLLQEGKKVTLNYSTFVSQYQIFSTQPNSLSSSHGH